MYNLGVARAYSFFSVVARRCLPLPPSDQVKLGSGMFSRSSSNV